MSTSRKIGRYEIVRLVGQGGMGAVYEGFDPNIGRRVAIKTIVVDKLSAHVAEELEARFRSEARIAARLIHPNIVATYDMGREAGVAYLVMEFIDGDGLNDMLKRGERLSFERIFSVMRDLLAALNHVHAQGIVHRDIKPGNMFIYVGGRLKLGSFDIAQITDSGESTMTWIGEAVGTLRYMSPEQMRGEHVDGRSDLWAAGVVLYQLLTGRRPFDGNSDTAIMSAVQYGNPQPPSVHSAAVTPQMDAVVLKALAKPVESRFASARDFMIALRAAANTMVTPVAGEATAPVASEGE